MRLRAFYASRLWELKSEGRFEEAQTLFEKAVAKDIPLNRKILGTMMCVNCEQKRYDAVMSLWDELHERKIRPSTALIAFHITALGGLNRLEEAEAYLDYFRKHKIFETNLINQLLDIFMKNDEHTRANNVLKFCAEHNLKFNLVSYSIMVEINLKLQNIDGINFILSQMAEDDITPDLSLYNRLMFAFETLGQPEGGLKIFKQMLKSGIIPDHRSYHSVIRLAAETKNTKLLEETFQYLYKRHMANYKTYKEMFKAYYKLENWKQAQTFFKLLKNEFDGEIGTMMVHVLRRLEKDDEAEKLEQLLVIRYRQLLEQTKTQLAKKLAQKVDA